MGYSCSAIAGMAAEKLESMLNESNPPPDGASNSWRAADGRLYFFERGRENTDGAVTGSIYRMEPDLNAGVPGRFFAHKVGSARIDPDGKIIRWPTASAEYRRAAEAWAAAEFSRIYGRVA